MRLTHSQIGMHLLIGKTLPRFNSGDLKARIQQGREWLRADASGQDFGYDALQWDEYLRRTEADSYTWDGRNPSKQQIQAAICQPSWIEAIRELTEDAECV
jgi:hypothetical protein